MSEFQEVSMEEGGSIPIYKKQPRTGGSVWYACEKCGMRYPAHIYDEKTGKWMENTHKCQS